MTSTPHCKHSSSKSIHANQLLSSAYEQATRGLYSRNYRTVAYRVFWPFCRPTIVGLQSVGPSYVRTLRSRDLKPSFGCLLWSLKSWNICPYYFRFAGRICPPNSDGDEELLAFGIFTKSLFLHLLGQFELGHLIWKVLVYFWVLERQDKMRLGVEDKSKYWISPLDGHLINVCYYLWFNFIPLQFFVSHHYSKVIRTTW